MLSLQMLSILRQNSIFFRVLASYNSVFPKKTDHIFGQTKFQ